jgi:hypothetical protein
MARTQWMLSSRGGTTRDLAIVTTLRAIHERRWPAVPDLDSGAEEPSGDPSLADSLGMTDAQGAVVL